MDVNSYVGNKVDFRRWLATDPKDHKCSLCCSLLNSQNISINNSEKRLVTYLIGHLRGSKKAAEVV